MVDEKRSYDQLASTSDPKFVVQAVEVGMDRVLRKPESPAYSRFVKTIQNTLYDLELPLGQVQRIRDQAPLARREFR